MAGPSEPFALLKGARNVRRFRPDPVPGPAVAALLEVARGTGSAANAQPWELVVVQDRETIRALAATGPNLGWMAEAPLLVVLVMAGRRAETEGFDEGRLAERIMLAARAQGLGAGLGWFLPGPARASAKQILGVPEDRTVRTVIAVGSAATPAAETKGRGTESRKRLDEIVHHGRYGAKDA